MTAGSDRPTETTGGSGPGDGGPVPHGPAGGGPTDRAEQAASDGEHGTRRTGRHRAQPTGQDGGTGPGGPFDVPLTVLRARTSEKWQAYGPDVLPMFVAELDVVPPRAVADAVELAVRSGDTGYEHGQAYAEAFAGFAAERFGWAVDPAVTRTVPDVMRGVVEVVRLFTAPGDAVVITPPVYPPFRHHLEHADRRVVAAPLTADGRLDPATLDRALGEARRDGRPAVLLLCQPHNPTGVLHTADELRAAGDLARSYGVRVVADEIHAAILPTRADGTRPAFVPTTTVVPDAIALHSASKAFNLAGLKGALAVPGPDAVADLARLASPVTDGISHVASIAHQAAFRAGGPWLDGLLDALGENVRLLGPLLADLLPSVRWAPGDGTYLAWLDLRDAVPAGTDPAAHLLEHARVATVTGPAFGVEGTGFARFNLGASPALLTEAVDRIAAALPARG